MPIKVVLLSNSNHRKPSLVKAEITLADVPERMMELGNFLKSLQGRYKKTEKANPQIALIMRRTMLDDIAEKRAQIDAIDRLIRQVFESGTLSRADRVELELHLYNCDTFRALTDDIIKTLRKSIKSTTS